MEVYCVKEKRHTPTYKVQKNIIFVKDGHKMLKVQCAVCGITKTRFLPGNCVSPPRGGRRYCL